MDPARVFPSEIFEQILYQVDGKNICDISRVCKRWQRFIDDDEYIWRYYCRHYNHRDIELGLAERLRWKEIFLKYKEKYDLIERWEKGLYKNIRDKRKIPHDFICELDADTWGYLVDLE